MLVAGFVLFSCAAWFSHGYINHDEHFQVIEFLGLKLNLVAPELLTWEYRTQSRSWFPAALFFVPARILLALGIDNPVHLVRGFRFLSGMIGFASVSMFYLYCRGLIKDPGLRIFFLCCLLFLCVMPSYHVRTSSENLSGSLMVLAVSLLLFKDASNTRFLLAGLLAAFAFHCRYQVGIMVAGQGLWILTNHKWSPKVWSYAAGMLSGLALGMAIDVWGWGEFQVTAWNYLRIQLLEGKVNEFGTSPWYQYFFLLWDDIPKPFGLMLFAAAGVFWLKFRRSVLTWMTLPFVLVHFLIGHKEVRFLIPVLYMSPLMLVMLVDGWSGATSFIQRRAVRVVAVLLLITNTGYLFKETFIAKSPSIAFIETIYASKAETLVWSGENPYGYPPLTMHFYQSPRLIALQDATAELPGGGRVLFYHSKDSQSADDSTCGGRVCLVDCVKIAAAWYEHLRLPRIGTGTRLRSLNSCRWVESGS